MNILKAIIIFYELKKRSFNEIFVLMPEGLYDEKENLIKFSRTISLNLCKVFSVGDTIKIKQNFKFYDILKTNFENIFYLYSSKKDLKDEKIQIVTENITLEDALLKVESFKNRTRKTVYEKFLEYMIIITFMESLKNSKVTLGGIWATGELKDLSGKRIKGYEIFVREISEKNKIVERLKILCKDYRIPPLEEIGLFKLPVPRKYISSYALYLESFYISVYLKNFIQRFHLMLAFATNEDRKNFSNKVEDIKKILYSYKELQQELDSCR